MKLLENEVGVTIPTKLLLGDKFGRDVGIVHARLSSLGIAPILTM
jgi:hypothetical protein